MAGKVRIKVFNLDGKSKSRMYPAQQVDSVLQQIAANIAEQCTTHRYEAVPVAGGYNFVLRGRVTP